MISKIPVPWMVGALVALSAVIYWMTRPDPIPVVMVEVEPGVVESTVANTRAGTVEACRRARMSPIIGGRVSDLPSREGARVDKGAVILELWNQDLRAQVRLAEGQARAAEARADEVCAMARVVGKEAERFARLVGEGVTSEEQTERAAGQAEAQAAGCVAAKTQLDVSQAQVDVSRAALERTIMRAPFDGVVAEINGELGEVVTPSPVGVATLPTVDLIDASCLYVHAPIDEVDAAYVRPGMPVRITLDAFPEEPRAGKVRRVAPYVLDLEKQARTVDVEVDFADPEDSLALLPGYSADVEIVLDRREGVLRAPSEALLEGHRLLVYDGSSAIEEREIEPGLANWQFTEIRSGVSPGEFAVLSIDREGVEDGATVVREDSAGKTS